MLTLYRIKARFIDADTQHGVHGRLADYFDGQPRWLADAQRRTSNARTLDELPFQLTAAKRWSRLYACLTAPEFLEASCAIDGIPSDLQNTGVYHLIENYRFALVAIPGGEIR